MAPPKEIASDLMCPQCAGVIGEYAIACPECGLDLIQNDPRPPVVISYSINRHQKSRFFYVSPLKLVVMSLATGGFYQLFWFYKNWYYVREHSHTKPWPLMRAMFRDLTLYWLLKEMAKAGEVQGLKCPYLPALIAVFYLGSELFGSVFSCLLSSLLLLPVQFYVNKLNANSPTPINDKFTPANWVAIVISSGIFVYIVAVLIGAISKPGAL
jgi:hypothetical protein